MTESGIVIYDPHKTATRLPPIYNKHRAHHCSQRPPLQDVSTFSTPSIDHLHRLQSGYTIHHSVQHTLSHTATSTLQQCQFIMSPSPRLALKGVRWQHPDGHNVRSHTSSLPAWCLFPPYSPSHSPSATRLHSGPNTLRFLRFHSRSPSSLATGNCELLILSCMNSTRIKLSSPFSDERLRHPLRDSIVQYCEGSLRRRTW